MKEEGVNKYKPMIVITDILKNPLDEGAKIATVNLLENIKKICGSYIVSVNSDKKLPFIDDYYSLNKLLFSPAFYSRVRKSGFRDILYIPEASSTPNSFLRARLLRAFTGKNIYMLSFQPRKYGAISAAIVRMLSAGEVITQSKKTADYLSGLGIPNNILPLGVDGNKYREYEDAEKKRLRDEYKIGEERKVVLHVGHIQESRNLDWLIRIRKECADTEVIMVGSTYNPNDEALYNKLENGNVRVVRDFIEKMEDIYNLADFYVFPVKRLDGAIGTPLSVLEALACNLPVITTRFGSLADVFKEDDCFRFVDEVTEAVDIINAGKKHNCGNRDKIGSVAWEHVAQQLVGMIG